MKKNNFGVPTLLLDEDGEPVDILLTQPQVGGEARIVFAQGVIDPHENFEGFSAQLEAWHRKHNPQLFTEEE